MIMTEVYHSRYGRQDEIVIFGGCKNDNWANGDIGIFVNGTVEWYSSENCWGSQTKLVRRTYFIIFIRTKYLIKEYTRYSTITILHKSVIT